MRANPQDSLHLDQYPLEDDIEETTMRISPHNLQRITKGPVLGAQYRARPPDMSKTAPVLKRPPARLPDSRPQSPPGNH
jgi:hypothetical protein